jgi:hypothetical protein
MIALAIFLTVFFGGLYVCGVIAERLAPHDPATRTDAWKNRFKDWK